MKKHLYLLMLTIAVVVMSELQIAGMMPILAADLGVAIGHIGLLASLYSLGMAIGGPLLVYKIRHIPPKRALLTVVGMYALLEGLTPIVHEYWWIAPLRVLTGCLSGAAFGLSVAFGVQLAEHPTKIGEAVSIVLGGIMAGTVIGLPLSHYISTALHWQASFYILAILTLCLCVVSACVLPSRQASSVEDSHQDIRYLRSPALWSRYLVSLLTIGAAFGSFSYFTPVLENNTRLNSSTITIVLFVYGLFSFLGNLVVGKYADRHATTILRIGHTAVVVALSTIALYSATPWLVIIMVWLVGCVGVTMNPALVTRVAEVGGTGYMVSTIHTSVITGGVTMGTAISAVSMSFYGDNPVVAMWVGVIIACLAAVVLAVQERQAV